MPGPRTKVHTGTNLWICNSDSYSYICYDLMILPGNSWKKHPRDKIGSKSHVFESKVWGACPDAATSTATVTATATCLSTLRRLEDICWSKPGSLSPLYHWDHFYRWTTSGNMITWYDILLHTLQWYAYIYIYQTHTCKLSSCLDISWPPWTHQNLYEALVPGPSPDWDVDVPVSKMLTPEKVWQDVTRCDKCKCQSVVLSCYVELRTSTLEALNVASSTTQDQRQLHQ